MIDLDEATVAIEAGWSKKTSYWPKTWTREDPSYGQCAVTALIVQEIFGGVIKFAEFRGSAYSARHYWNEVEGKKIDLTAKQLPKDAKMVGEPRLRTRQELLRTSSVKSRYALLKRNVSPFLFDDAALVP